jgi:hypothetical protein
VPNRRARRPRRAMRRVWASARLVQLLSRSTLSPVSIPSPRRVDHGPAGLAPGDRLLPRRLHGPDEARRRLSADAPTSSPLSPCRIRRSSTGSSFAPSRTRYGPSRPTPRISVR